MAYAAWSVSFGERPSAAKWNILGTNDASFADGTGIAVSAITPEKLLTGTGTTWPWTAWTPSWTNLTVGTGGNATNQGYRIQIGKTVFYRVIMVFGTSGSSMGTNPYFVAPVAPKSSYYNASSGLVSNMGYAVLLDTGLTEYTGFARVWSGDTTKFDIVALETSSTYGRVGNITGTIPFTWASGDAMAITGAYEAA